MNWIETQNQSINCCDEWQVAWECSECGEFAPCIFCSTGIDEDCDCQA